MIKVTRTPKPLILIKNEVAWTLAIRNAINQAERDRAISKYKHKKIKSALSDMFNGKCAFCEAYIEHVDYGDIEHFKPKSRFPLEAVNWDNLLLSCKKCNDKGQKGNNWPLENEGGLLINPCIEEPSAFFEFIFDKATNTSIVKPKCKRGETSERIYGLNKISLVRHRNVVVKKLVALATYYNTDQIARDLLDEATESKSEYAAFARMIKEKYV